MMFHMKWFEENTEHAEEYMCHTHNFYRKQSISVLGEMHPSRLTRRKVVKFQRFNRRRKLNFLRGGDKILYFYCNVAENVLGFSPTDLSCQSYIGTITRTYTKYLSVFRPTIFPYTL